jgi:hypothetical protein
LAFLKTLQSFLCSSVSPNPRVAWGKLLNRTLLEIASFAACRSCVIVVTLPDY